MTMVKFQAPSTKFQNLILLLVLLSLLLFSQTVFALGPIVTGTLSPSQADLCGTYARNVTFTASTIQNNGTINLTEVKATLLATNSSGIRFLSAQEVSLGTLSANQSSAINPQWTLGCNESFPGITTLYINYTSAEGINSSSLDQATSFLNIYPNDKTAPTVIKHSPGKEPTSEVITTSTTLLKVTTDEEATCKYSTQQNVPFAEMTSTFTLTGGKEHERLLSDLKNGMYTFYVKCQDSNGNIAAQDYKLVFEVDFIPTAEISLADPSPVSFGTIEVTLLATEELLPIPQLKYSFGEEKDARFVSLTGSGRQWKGYLFIIPEDNKKVGTFYFSGQDLKGNKGVVITSGNIFLVDTEGPTPPSLVNARVLPTNLIQLDWHYPGKEAASFNLYRSTNPEVTYLNFYKSIPASRTSLYSLVDTGVTPGVAYFYALSSVDGAGNEGALSPIAKAGVSSVNVSEGLVEVELPEGDSSGVESVSVQTSSLSEADKNLLSDLLVRRAQDLGSFIEELTTLRSSLKQKYAEEVEKLKISDLIKAKKSELLELKKTVTALQEKDFSAEEAQKKLKEVEEKMKLIKTEIPQEITKESKVTLSLTSLTQEDFAVAFQEWSKKSGKALNEKDKEKYLKKLEKIQADFIIQSEVQPYVITSLGNTTRKVLMVTKKIFSQQEKSVATHALEIVPKDVAEKSDQLSLGEGLEVLNPDPVLSVALKSDSATEIQYVLLNAEIDAQKIAGTKTIFMPSFDEAKAGGGITGFMTAPLEKLTNIDMYSAGIYLSILVSVLLCGYYFFPGRSAKKKKALSNLSHPSQSPSGFKKVMQKCQEAFGFLSGKKKEQARTYFPTSYALPTAQPLPSALCSLPTAYHSPSLSTATYPLPLAANPSLSLPTTPYPLPPTNGQPLTAYQPFHYAEKEYKNAGLISLQETSLQYLLRMAEQAANAFAYDNAVKYYHLLSTQQEGIASPQKAEMIASRKQIHRLEKKLTLLVKLQQLQQCHLQGDLANMKYVLNEIAALHNALCQGHQSEELTFLQTVKMQHTQYSQTVLNHSTSK